MAEADERRKEPLEVYVLPLLKAMQAEASKRTQEGRRLHEAATDAINALQQQPGLPIGGSLVHTVLAPLLLGCRSGASPRIAENALKAVHSLVSNAYIADRTDLGPIASAVTAAAELRSSTVQLAVIRAIVSLCTSQEVTLSHSTIVLCVRCLCNLAIAGVSEQIAMASRGAAFQVIDFAVSRFLACKRRERARDSSSDGVASPEPHTSPTGSAAATPTAACEGDVYSEQQRTSIDDPRTLATLAEYSHVNELEAALGDRDDADEDDVVHSSSGATSGERHAHSAESANISEHSDDASHRGALLSNHPSSIANHPENNSATSYVTSGSTESVAPLDGSNASGVSGSDAQETHEIKPPVEIKTIKREGSRRRRSSRSRTEDEDVGEHEVASSGMSQIELDAKLVIRALCRLALREPEAGDDSYSSKARALALDLLRQLLSGQNGPDLLEEASETLRRPLSKGLVRNGSSTNTGAFYLSTQILLALMLRARHRFKVEIGVLYPLLVLKPMEHMVSATSGYANEHDAAGSTSSAFGTSSVQVGATHAHASLGLVKSLWSSPQAVADIFANYDCDVASPDVYWRTVRAVRELHDNTSNGKIRTTALDCILVLTDSLEHWSSPGDFSSNSASRTYKNLNAESNGMGVEKSTAFLSDSNVESGMDEQEQYHDREDETDEAERFNEAKSRKRKMESAAAEFNAKPVEAMATFVDRGEVGASADEQARFLTETHGLDKEKLGEFLGHHGENEVAVMQHYMRQFDFAEMELDEALRRFLDSFRLPGEAQKIDRIVEAFASRFAQCNPASEFGSESAYIVSFAIVMLNTDAHNPAMEGGKMSKEDFVQMATSSESSSDVTREKLEAIYERIVQHKLDVPSGSCSGTTKNGASRAVSAAVDFAMPWKRRHEREMSARREAEQLLEQTRSAFNSDQRGSVYQKASSPALARLMLESAGDDVLQSLTSAFESASNASDASKPLYGARKALRLAATLRLGKLRAKFVSFLAQAPSLDAPRAVSARHGEALRVLLELASSAESYPLGEAWAAVLTALSQLQQLRLVGTTEKHATPFIPKREPQTPAVAELKGIEESRRLKEQASSRTGDYGNTSDTESSNRLHQLHFQQQHHHHHHHHPFLDKIAPALTELHHNQLGHLGDLKIPPDVIEHMGEWLRETGDDVVDRVFASTVNLDSDEVVHFTKALAAVSRAELWPASGSQPQLFSLYRLVELAHANLGRVRVVWSRIWSVVANHLVQASTHWQDHVAVCAVDALRQVSSAVLRRSITTGAAHEADAFKPFETVIRSAPAATARELAIQAVGNMLEAFGKDVGSGHKSALLILGECAKDPSEMVAEAALSASERVASAIAVRLPDDCIADAINTVASFASRGMHGKLQHRALTVLREASDSLAQRMYSDTVVSSTSYGESATELAWVPLLTAIADVSFGNGSLAEEALEALFSVVQKHAAMLSKSVWRRASDMALLPLMDPARAELMVDDQEEWLVQRARNILPRLYHLIRSSEAAAETMVEDVCSRAAQAACASRNELAVEGLRALAYIGKHSCLRSEQHWLHWLHCVQQAIHVHSCARRWDLHLGCVTALGECVSEHASGMPATAMRQACETLAQIRSECFKRNREAVEEAQAFGRTEEHKQMHGRAEVASGTALFACTEKTVQYHIDVGKVSSAPEHSTHSFAAQKLGDECEAVIVEAAELEDIGRWKGRSLRAMRAPLVARAVAAFGAVPDSDFMLRLRRAYTSLARLVCTDQPQVCKAVSWLFTNRLAPVITTAVSTHAQESNATQEQAGEGSSGYR